MDGTNIRIVGAKQFEAREWHSCEGCAAEEDDALCIELGACSNAPVIWIESSKAAPARLTKPEIDALKQRAIDQYGATWLHEFGSFVEAEVYSRLGVELPSQAQEVSGDAV